MAGKVTALTVQKNNKKRVSVHLDGRFAFGLPALVAASLRLGQLLSDADVEALREKGDVEQAYNRALNYLSYRPRSRAEVAQYLQKHDVSEEKTREITDRLERAGLLGDEEFARYWVGNRESFRPRGPRALRYELRSKGVSAEAIEQALDSLDVSESAYRASVKKARQLGHLDHTSFVRKVMEYLGRRGFEYEVAREAAECHWAETHTQSAVPTQSVGTGD